MISDAGTSDAGTPQNAFVWIWLPGATKPIVAGRIVADGETLIFNYGRSYLARDDAIAIYDPELPLAPGAIRPAAPLAMANALRDAAPDAWGRRVIINRLTGATGRDADAVNLGELTFLLESGSDRAGALDFQASATDYVPRGGDTTSLDLLAQSAEHVEKGRPLTPELAEALQHGTAIGGARPKTLVTDGTRRYVAKFSSSSDTYNVVKAEFVAMRLASMAGLDAAPVALTQAMNKDVLLVARFDRNSTSAGWTRRAMVSALTLFGLDERMAAHASYEEFADIVRRRFTDPKRTLKELFGRLVFNILVGNSDDHARNHAAFWDGRLLTLTPAYDICPQPRTGREASQAMRINRAERRSTLSLCLATAPKYLLTAGEATGICRRLIAAIREHFEAVCDEAALAPVDRRFLWRRQFLNALAFEGLEDELGDVLAGLVDG